MLSVFILILDVALVSFNLLLWVLFNCWADFVVTIWAQKARLVLLWRSSLRWIGRKPLITVFVVASNLWIAKQVVHIINAGQKADVELIWINQITHFLIGIDLYRLNQVSCSLPYFLVQARLSNCSQCLFDFLNWQKLFYKKVKRIEVLFDTVFHVFVESSVHLTNGFLNVDVTCCVLEPASEE